MKYFFAYLTLHCTKSDSYDEHGSGGGCCCCDGDDDDDDDDDDEDDDDDNDDNFRYKIVLSII